jgi:hypothetical protein
MILKLALVVEEREKNDVQAVMAEVKSLMTKIFSM